MRSTVLLFACLAALASACLVASVHGQYLGASWVRVEPQDACFSYLAARNSPGKYCQVVNACNSTVFVYPIGNEPVINVEVDLLNTQCSGSYSVDSVALALRQDPIDSSGYHVADVTYCVDILSSCCRADDVNCQYGDFCKMSLSCNGKNATVVTHLTEHL